MGHRREPSGHVGDLRRATCTSLGIEGSCALERACSHAPQRLPSRRRSVWRFDIYKTIRNLLSRASALGCVLAATKRGGAPAPRGDRGGIGLLSAAGPRPSLRTLVSGWLVGPSRRVPVSDRGADERTGLDRVRVPHPMLRAARCSRRGVGRAIHRYEDHRTSYTRAARAGRPT